MALTPNTTATNNIAVLDKLPNDVGGLSAASFQLLFDKFGTDFKTYFNDVHLVEIATQLATKDELIGIVLGDVADGSITIPKLSFDPATQSELDNAVALLIPLAEKGAANGIPTLGSDGLLVQKQSAIGTYTGNGVNGRAIAVGFRPSFVYIKDTTFSNIICYTLHDGSSGLCHYQSGMQKSPSLIINSNGFQLGGYSVDANESAYTYGWVAIR